MSVERRVGSLVGIAMELARTHESLRGIVSKAYGNRGAIRLATATTEFLNGVLALADAPPGSDLEERLDALEEQMAAILDAIRRLAPGSQESVRRTAAAASGIDEDFGRRGSRVKKFDATESPTGALPDASDQEDEEDSEDSVPEDQERRRARSPAKMPPSEVGLVEKSEDVQMAVGAFVGKHLLKADEKKPAPDAESVKKIVSKVVEYKS